MGTRILKLQTIGPIRVAGGDSISFNHIELQYASDGPNFFATI